MQRVQPPGIRLQTITTLQYILMIIDSEGGMRYGRKPDTLQISIRRKTAPEQQLDSTVMTPLPDTCDGTVRSG